MAGSMISTATQDIPLLDQVVASNAAVASYNSTAPIDLSQVKRALYILQIGVMNTSATLDGRLQSCKFVSFNTAVHNIGGTNLTQIINSATNLNILASIEVRADQVTGANAGDRYVRLNTTVGTSQVNYGAIGLGYAGEQRPESQYNSATTIQQQIVCNL